MNEQFDEIFNRVRPMFAALEPRYVLKRDEPGAYYLDTHEVREDGYRTAFGGLEIKKRYVSIHLIPVYRDPGLLDGVSEALRKRMQGKSCFNFSKNDDVLMEELAELVMKSDRRFGSLSPYEGAV